MQDPTAIGVVAPASLQTILSPHADGDVPQPQRGRGTRLTTSQTQMRS